MTWEIAVGIIALAGFLITVGTLTYKLGALHARLEAAVKTLSEERRTKEKEGNAMRAELRAQEIRLRELERRNMR